MTRTKLPLFLPYSLCLGLVGVFAPACAAPADDPGLEGDSESDTDEDPGDDGTSDGGTGGSSDGDPTGDDSDGDADPGDSGGTSGGEPDDGTSGGPDDPVDDTPPYVVSMSPHDAESGVLVDTDLVVTFSEPMDKVATQAAYQSADIPAGTMAWNDAGDVLTITPAEYLEWSFVESPDEPAIVYVYTITSVARDLAGNEMHLGEEAAFTTMRGQNIMLTANQELSGSVSKAGNHAYSAAELPLAAGDTIGDDRVAVLLTFDFSAIPEETVALAGALFQGLQDSPFGTPYGDLGELTLQTVSYENLIPAQETIPSDHDYGTVSSSGVPALFEVDVSAEVLPRFDDGFTNMQFRVRHESTTDGGGDEDLTVFQPAGVALWVTAAYP